MKRRLLSLLALLVIVVTGAKADGIVATKADVGKVLCTDGSIKETVSAATNAGKTPAAMIAYVNEKTGEGLAIALEDETGTYLWNSAKSAAAAHEPLVAGGTWRLPSVEDFEYMMRGCAGYFNYYSGVGYGGGEKTAYYFKNLIEKMEAAGCTTMQYNPSSFYFTRSIYEANYQQFVATLFVFENGIYHTPDGQFSHESGSYPRPIRACLAFNELPAGAVKDVQLDRSSISVILNGVGSLTAKMFPSDPTNPKVVWTTSNSNVKLYSDNACTHEVSGETEVHTVYVKGMATGSSDITVTSCADNTKTASCTATVSNVDVTSFSLSPTSATMGIDEVISLKATIYPNQASDKTVKWTTNNSRVKLYFDAECTSAVGSAATEALTVYAKGVDMGNVTITATSNSNSSKKGTCTVTVTKGVATLSEAVDNSVFIASHVGKTFDITLTRTLKGNMWNTFSVPFNISHDQMTQLFTGAAFVMALRTTDYNDGNLVFNCGSAWQIVAGTAYLVKLEYDLVNPIFHDVIISDAYTSEYQWSTYADFVPVINPVNLPAGDKTKLFVIPNDLLTYPVKDSTIKGFRGYFQLKGSAAASEARSFSIDFGGEATGLNGVLVNSEGEVGEVYNLKGQRVTAPQKGLYIVNGKKIIK